MKILGRVLILGFAWVLLVGAVYPVRYTPWADGVRVQVQEARARRRAQMSNAQSNAQSNPHRQRGGEVQTAPTKSTSNVVSVPRSGPKAKPANLSWQSVASIWKFALYTLVPCLITVLVLAVWRAVFPISSGSFQKDVP